MACKLTTSKSPTQNIEDAQDIRMRPGQGDYEVLCKDGTTEIVTIEQLRQGEVCVGRAARSKIVCGQVAHGYVPISTENGRPIGDPMDQSSCQLATQASKFEAVCGLKNRIFGLYRVTDQAWLGGLGTITACVAASNNAKRGTVCVGLNGQTRLTSIATGQAFGDGLEFQECQNLIGNVRYLSVCARIDGQFHVVRVTDGQKLGDGTDFHTCNNAISNSSLELTCVSKLGGMVPARYTDGLVLGDVVTPSACNNIVSVSKEGITCSMRRGAYYLTRIQDNASLSSEGDIWQGCLDSLKAANFKVVCTPERDLLVPTRVLDQYKLGQAMLRQNCLDATKAILRDTICTHRDGQFYLTKISTGEYLGGARPWNECIRAQRNGAF